MSTPTILSISGINPLTDQPGSNAITLSDVGAATIGPLILQSMHYSATVPDWTWTPTVDDGHGNQIPNPVQPQPMVANPWTPGTHVLMDIWNNYLLPKARAQAAANDAAATNAHQQAVAAVVAPVIS